MPSSTFSIRAFSGSSLSLFAIESTTGRIVLEGYKSPNAYTTKFMVESISSHPDFQTLATWTMNALSSGTDDIIADSGQTISAVSFEPITALSLTNQTVNYVLVSSSTSDINYFTNDQSLSVLESTITQTTPELS